MGKKSAIPKRLGERIKKVLDHFDSECELVGLNSDILEMQMPEEIALKRKLIDGDLQELFTGIENKSFDIGFAVGYTVAQMPQVSKKEFKPIVEDMRKLIINRRALSKQV